MNGSIIRAPNHLGDCVMALASLQSLPDGLKYNLLVPHWSEPLYRHLPGAKLHLISAGHLHGPSAIMHQRRIVRKASADRGLLLTPSFSSALIFALAGLKKKSGFASDGRGFLLTDPIDAAMAPAHRAEKYRFMLETFFAQKLSSGIPRIIISPPAFSETARLVEQLGTGETGRYIVIAAQAVAASRRWGTANFADLAGRLIERFGIKIVLLGATAECRAGEEIRANHKDIVNLCGQTDIETAAAILSRAILFVGNDSGLAHLAGGVGVPLVVLSGADNPKETSPLAAKKTVIIKNNLECISCIKNNCPLPGEKFMQCMKQISVEEVFEAALRYLL